MSLVKPSYKYKPSSNEVPRWRKQITRYLSDATSFAFKSSVSVKGRAFDGQLDMASTPNNACLFNTGVIVVGANNNVMQMQTPQAQHPADTPATEDNATATRSAAEVPNQNWIEYLKSILRNMSATWKEMSKTSPTAPAQQPAATAPQ